MVVTHAPVPVDIHYPEPVLLEYSADRDLARRQPLDHTVLRRLYDPPDITDAIYNAKGQNGLGPLTGLIVDYYT